MREVENKCEKCLKTFSTFSNLKRHKLTHDEMKRTVFRENRTFQCNICGLKVRDNYQLKLHLRTHNKDRPFKCEDCQHSFTRNGDLKRHKACCTGVVTNCCERCGKVFKNKVSHNEHVLWGSTCGRLNNIKPSDNFDSGDLIRVKADSDFDWVGFLPKDSEERVADLGSQAVPAAAPAAVPAAVSAAAPAAVSAAAPAAVSAAAPAAASAAVSAAAPTAAAPTAAPAAAPAAVSTKTVVFGDAVGPSYTRSRRKFGCGICEGCIKPECEQCPSCLQSTTDKPRPCSRRKCFHPVHYYSLTKQARRKPKKAQTCVKPSQNKKTESDMENPSNIVDSLLPGDLNLFEGLDQLPTSDVIVMNENVVS